MLISRAFPSAYIKAEDLQDTAHSLIMDRVKVEEVGDDTKPVLYFRGAKKGLALNKTNANTISAAYGEETDDWSAQEIILYPTMTDFQGRQTPCIRVRIPDHQEERPREAVLPVAAMRPVKPNGNGRHLTAASLRQELSDEIPF